ncbi:TAXI family TRAP transporter solute-binding subunit [Chloroflexota bacterium]
MKVKLGMIVCLLVAVLLAVGCAPSAAPSGEGGYEAIRIVGASLGSESTRAALVLATVLNRYYPEIEWSSSSGPGSNANLVMIHDGRTVVGTTTKSGFISAFGLDKVDESRIRSINIPRPSASRFFAIPADKDWYDITDIPEGSTLCPGPPGTGVTRLSEIWVEVTGLSKDYFNWIPLGKDELSDAWRAGKVDLALISPTGESAYLMNMALSPRGVKAMGLTPEQAAKAKASRAFLEIGYEAPAESNLTEILPDIFKYNVLAPTGVTYLSVRDDFPEEIAYKMAKIFDEHHDEIAEIFPGLRNGATPQLMLSFAEAPMEMHSGVAKYYREKGYLK